MSSEGNLILNWHDTAGNIIEIEFCSDRISYYTETDEDEGETTLDANGKLDLKFIQKIHVTVTRYPIRNMEKSDDELLRRPKVKDIENTLRALYPPQWDEKAQRGTAGVFRHNRKSVSRPSILKEEAIIEIFKNEIETTETKIKAVAEFNVGEFRKCAESYPNKEMRICVHEDPTVTNISHAEVTGTNLAESCLVDIPRGLSKKLLDLCTIKLL